MLRNAEQTHTHAQLHNYVIDLIDKNAADEARAFRHARIVR